jgi:hypothetical protein
MERPLSRPSPSSARPSSRGEGSRGGAQAGERGEHLSAQRDYPPALIKFVTQSLRTGDGLLIPDPHSCRSIVDLRPTGPSCMRSIIRGLRQHQAHESDHGWSPRLHPRGGRDVAVERSQLAADVSWDCDEAHIEGSVRNSVRPSGERAPSTRKSTRSSSTTSRPGSVRRWRSRLLASARDTEVDADGAWLDGAKQYRLRLPPDVPAKNFWSVAVYDTQTRSLVQTDDPYPSLSSLTGTVHPDHDGSTDVFFGPEPPEGYESKLDPDGPREGLVHHPAPLRPARTVVRQDVAARRDPTNEALALARA